MDISNKYIKMCEMSEEIQKLKPFNNDDGFHCKIGDEFYIVKGEHYYQRSLEVLKGKDYKLFPKVWLPRRDQLQDMLYSLEDNVEMVEGIASVACPNVICEDILEFSRCDCEYGLETMEQLWLAYVMHEKYSKVWLNDEWVDKDIED